VQSAEVGNNQIRSADVRDDTLAGGGLTGADITNQSGVDTCTHGAVRFGELCVGVANQHHNWYDARNLCAGLELRLPSLGEAESLAQNYDLPSVDQGEYFWTDEAYYDSAGPAFYAYVVSDGFGATVDPAATASDETLCVTTPTN